MSHWAASLPSQSSLSLLVPRPQNFRAHPRILVGAMAMLPVGKQKQVPKPTPPSLYPRGLNMQREFCWDPPIQSVIVPTWVAGLVWTYTHKTMPHSRSYS